MSRRILGISEVCHLTGRSRSTVRRYVADPDLNFPPPVRVGHRDRGWFSDEVAAWIDSRPVRNKPTATDARRAD
jgi:predicted DNA-binding transcriptional regulator AlpA